MFARKILPLILLVFIVALLTVFTSINSQISQIFFGIKNANVGFIISLKFILLMSLIYLYLRTVKELRIKEKFVQNIRFEKRIIEDEKKQLNKTLLEKIKGHERTLESLKKYKDDLLQDNKFIYQLLNHLPIAIFVKNVEDRKFVYWNKESELLTGLSFKDAIGKTDFDLFDEQEAKLFSKEDEEVISSFKIREKNVEVLSPNLGKRYLNVKTIPLLDNNGKLSSLLGISIDLSEQTEQKEKLKQSENRYRELLDSINYLIARIDLRNKITFVNDACTKKFGITEEEFLGKSISQFIYPDDLDIVNEELQKLSIKAGRSQIEIRLVTKEGNRWIAFENNSIVDGQGNVIGIQVIGRDITEQKESETRLKYQTIAIEKTMNGVIITDPNLLGNPIIYCNPAFEKMTGYKSSEIIGKNPRILQGPGTSIEAIKKMHNSVKDGKECIVKLKNYRKDGSSFWNEVIIIPIRDKQDNLINFLGVKRDITDRLDYEHKIEESESKFRGIVEQSTDGIILCNENGNIIEWNASLEKLTGLNRDQVIGEYLWDIIFNLFPKANQNPEQLESIKNKILQYLKNGDIRWLNKSLEGEIVNYKGEISIIQSIAFPITTKYGKMLGTIIRDVTKEKQRDEVERINRIGMESTNSGIFIFNSDYKITFVNKSLLRMTKHGIETNLLEKEVFQLFEDEKKKQVKEIIINETLDKGFWKGEFVLQRIDGSTFPVDLTFSIVNDNLGNAKYVFVIVVDITKRKLQEEALLNSEAKYRHVVDNIKEIIFQTDAEGRWEFLNPAWEEITGFSLKESLGQNFIEYVHPEDREKNGAYFADLVARKKDYCRHVIRYLTKDDGIKWIEVYARLVLNKNTRLSALRVRFMI